MENNEPVSSPSFSNKIDTLVKQFPPILADFKKNYVLTKMYPKDESYKNFYNNSKSQIVNSTAHMFAINNDIQNELNKIHKKTFTLDENIQQQKQMYDILKKELEQSKGGSVAARIMSKDYRINYTRQYIINCTMLLGIVIGWVCIQKTFNVKTT